MDIKTNLNEGARSPLAWLYLYVFTEGKIWTRMLLKANEGTPMCALLPKRI